MEHKHLTIFLNDIKSSVRQIISNKSKNIKRFHFLLAHCADKIRWYYLAKLNGRFQTVQDNIEILITENLALEN